MRRSRLWTAPYLDAKHRNGLHGGSIRVTIFSSAIQSVRALRHEAPTREAALALLLCLCDLWAFARDKGDLALEAHVEAPLTDSLFLRHQAVCDLPWLLTPLVDFARRLTLGCSNAKQARRLLLAYRETERRALEQVLRQASMVWPLGLCLWLAGLAVLGETGITALAWWGASLAAAGVVAGVWLVRLRAIVAQRLGILDAMIEGCLSYLNGYVPRVCAENARSVLPPALRPSCFDLDEALGANSTSIRAIGTVAARSKVLDLLGSKDESGEPTVGTKEEEDLLALWKRMNGEEKLP
ncbi:Flagellar motor component [Paramagnetospirillum magneticum AMB-1]|uniref:Flagellar motor component n=1 Tax=Paramagnetospirillum magneticum (strain ATCC 700264 / AMB-1) TaxID=342108 RepID=Q2W6M3_PARM1|nr:Flagellar motor component [Paramagnetospirillum magneticum AMB-1]